VYRVEGWAYVGVCHCREPGGDRDGEEKGEAPPLFQ
jgi:hypothetical protein